MTSKAELMIDQCLRTSVCPPYLLIIQIYPPHWYIRISVYPYIRISVYPYIRISVHPSIWYISCLSIHWFPWRPLIIDPQCWPTKLKPNNGPICQHNGFFQTMMNYCVIVKYDQNGEVWPFKFMVVLSFNTRVCTLGCSAVVGVGERSQGKVYDQAT